MGTVTAVPIRPFRWDLARPDQLGTLVGGASPDLWFLDALVECAARVVACSGGGDLVFVGRSGDSLYDFLTGVLDGTGYEDRLYRFPFSWRRPTAASHLSRAREVLTASGVTRERITRGPVAFVDVVCTGTTFAGVYALVRDWVAEPYVRRHLHFTGITSREQPSPATVRWQQDAAWTSELRPSAIRNVSLDERVWSYLADNQPKLTRPFRPDRDTNVCRPRHDERARAALAEALAIVAHGRSAAGRRAFVRVLMDEPAVAQRWLRDLAVKVSRSRCSRSRGTPSTSGGCT